MNRTMKRCLLSLVASATMFGIARGQEQLPAGTVQVGPGAPGTVQVGQPPVVPPVNGGPTGPVMEQPGVSSAQPNQVYDVDAAGNVGRSSGFYRVSPIDEVMTPRLTIDSRGGPLYGYNAGYANVGTFVPYKLSNTSILFAQGMGMVTYDGQGGATIGGGWRTYDDVLDRIFGLSAFFDFDNGHAKPYQQLGFSLESLGRYTDLRVNGYAPVSSSDHVLQSTLLTNAILVGNGIQLTRFNQVEQAFAGFDAEVGGPTPFLGRYGLNAYVGGYHFMGTGSQGGQFTGVSGRLQTQINENVQFNVQVTNDNMFGLNTQFQVFVNLPNGSRPGRWLRNLRVQDRMVQNVFRENRVRAKTEDFVTTEAAINPKTGKDYFVALIDPNSTLPGAGDGSITNPFHSVAEYESQAIDRRLHTDLIFVKPGDVSTNANLNTFSAFAPTLDLFSGQRLLATTVTQTFESANLPGVEMTVTGFETGAAPILFNSAGNDVITLASNNTQCLQVSGFEIHGSATGSGIAGNYNTFVKIDRNDISDGAAGISLFNLNGTIAAGTQAIFMNNNIHDNLGNGLQINNATSLPLEMVVQGNKFQNNGLDGMLVMGQPGAIIRGIIGGQNTAATSTTPAVTRSNTFDGNGRHGLNIQGSSSTLDFGNGNFGIVNNIFTRNNLDGLHIDAVNSSVSDFAVINNQFGLASDPLSGNGRFGVSLFADSGTTNMTIGGPTVTLPDGTTFNPGNSFNFNVVSAIDLAVAGNAILNYEISNNTIANAVTATTAAPKDTFTLTYNGISGTDPFLVTNNSDSGVSITGLTWNLAGTPAYFVSQSQTLLSTGSPVMQIVGGSDLTTGLSAINGTAVIAGSNPLVTGTGVTANASNLAIPFTQGNLVNNLSSEYFQVLPLSFNSFNSGDVLRSTALQTQLQGTAALTSAATIGSTVTATFSNGLTATAKIAADPTTGSLAVAATGTVFGAATPGFGTGSDAIHVSASGSSIVSTAIIHDNSIKGYGGYGAHIETHDTASIANQLIYNNTIQSNGIGVSGSGVATFTGGGINLERFDSSLLTATIDTNDLSSNFNNGISLSASGTAVGGLNVNSFDNNVTSNAGNGLNSSSSGAAILKLTSMRDNFSGSGSTSNINVTGGDNIALNTAGTSVSTITFENVTANGATGNGLSATTQNGSILNLNIISQNDPNSPAGTVSSFSNNGGNGLQINTGGPSALNLNIDSIVVQNGTLIKGAFNNNQNGIAFNRQGASLINADIANSSLSNNAVNGFLFHGLGANPQDPNQQNSGTPNQITLTNVDMNFNGNFTTGIGQGARIDLLGDSELVLNANGGSSFNNNAENGMRISITPGAEFGYRAGNQRSIFDNVSFNNNGANGIQMVSEITQSQPGNGILPYDVSSITYMQISALTGNTTISNNGQNGFLAQFPGGSHDILIEGDGLAGTAFTTKIQGNKLDGVHSEAGIGTNPFLSGNADSGVTFTLNNVLVGGPNAVDSNLGDGIDVESQSVMRIVDGQSFFVWNWNGAGQSSLNLDNTTVQNNGSDGIRLISNDLQFNGFEADGVTFATRSEHPFTYWYGTVNANVQNSRILQNKEDGVNINLLGNAFGNTFVFNNNTIASNGGFGFFIEQNVANDQRNGGNINQYFRVVGINDPQPTTPPGPFDPNSIGQVSNANGGTNANIVGAAFMSNFMNLATDIQSSLVMTNNVIQFNGTGGNLQRGDGVFIRVGTNTYLSADVRNNTMSGNLANDFHVESFVSYNPIDGSTKQPTGSVAVTQPPGPPPFDTLVLDDSAQLDLRFTGNSGTSLNIQSPFVNTIGAGSTLLGNTTPNGAVFAADPLKDNFSFDNPSPRIVQIFQVDDGANLNATNSFSIFGNGTLSVQDAFSSASWYLRTVADPSFPNFAFPQSYNDNPPLSFLNPFLP